MRRWRNFALWGRLDHRAAHRGGSGGGAHDLRRVGNDGHSGGNGGWWQKTTQRNPAIRPEVVISDVDLTLDLSRADDGDLGPEGDRLRGRGFA